MSVISEKYAMAKEQYASIGVDTDTALEKLSKIPVSVHCWQGDDVTGFEKSDGELTGGIQVTGAYPGKARTPEELRQDIKKAFTYIPGELKLNLHAIYLESVDGKMPDRDEIKPENFANWVSFAKENKIGLDFNPTLFSHDKSADGFTLSSADEEKRAFWIKHCKAARKVGEYFGRELGKACVTNIWIADGFKDLPVDRLSPRLRLKDSLDKILEDKIDPKYNLDAVECKLFGIGSESCVIGSHEFYMGYAAKNDVLLTLDAGHFHPTEVISDKLSSVLTFCDEVLLHVSRPVRWDSDHIVTFSDELICIAEEIIRNDFTDRVHIGLDYFDGSVNRIAAWIIGTRNMKKALLKALLEPTAKLKKAELEGDYTTRLVMLEELKTFPLGSVWDYYCEINNMPAGATWLDDVKKYEQEVLLKRK